jgi:Zn finger protein HypA/HybF (possibly regulating hydrogenase expression)
MHELAVAQAIVGAAERHADGRPVSVVRVRIGRLRQVVPEYLSFYFEIAAEETACDGAQLEWERVPSLLRCSECGAEWDPAPPPAREQDQLIVRFRCPECESADHRVVSGDELVVESIDVTEPAVRGS